MRVGFGSQLRGVLSMSRKSALSAVLDLDIDDFLSQWSLFVALDELDNRIVDNKVNYFDHRQDTAAHQESKEAAHVAC